MNKRYALIWLNIALLVITWVMAYTSYQNLPDRIPVHFNFEGQPDRWAEKTPFNFFGIPAVQTAIIVLMLIFLRYPRLYNFPQKKEIKNWPKKYSTPVYDFLKFAVLIIALTLNLFFILIQRMMIESARAGQAGKSWPWLMLPAVLVWLLLLIYILAKMNKVIAMQKIEMSRNEPAESRL